VPYHSQHTALTRLYDQLIDEGVTTAPLYVSNGHETEADALCCKPDAPKMFRAICRMTGKFSNGGVSAMASTF